MDDSIIRKRLATGDSFPSTALGPHRLCTELLAVAASSFAPDARARFSATLAGAQFAAAKLSAAAMRSEEELASLLAADASREADAAAVNAEISRLTAELASARALAGRKRTYEAAARELNNTPDCAALRSALASVDSDILAANEEAAALESRIAYHRHTTGLIFAVIADSRGEIARDAAKVEAERAAVAARAAGALAPAPPSLDDDDDEARMLRAGGRGAADEDGLAQLVVGELGDADHLQEEEGGSVDEGEGVEVGADADAQNAASEADAGAIEEGEEGVDVEAGEAVEEYVADADQGGDVI